MVITLAFDVYGTLIDTQGITSLLGRLVGEQANACSKAWREKQLEYSFRRGLMQKYQNFAQCTSDALDYTCSTLNLPLSPQQKQELLEAYSFLPAFADVAQGLSQAQKAGFRLFAFSNGSTTALEKLLTNAGIRKFFVDLVSADEKQTFKPDPKIYDHFLQRSGALKEEAWLVSSNPFDVIGAAACSMNSAWVQRSENSIFDPWEFQPNMIVKSLLDLTKGIQANMELRKTKTKQGPS
ncbi:MAG: haloacid dehalogenase type II [SAR324 cluster bacterium]|nr:haloacid dehalogenase type II [SAR324 cluster bacterium]